MKPISPELVLWHAKTALLDIFRVFRAVFAVLVWLIGFSALIAFIVISVSMVASGYNLRP